MDYKTNIGEVGNSDCGLKVQDEKECNSGFDHQSKEEVKNGNVLNGKHEKTTKLKDDSNRENEKDVTKTAVDLNGKGISGSENDTDFDDILPYAGEFGLYQAYLFVLTMPFYFFFAFTYFGQIFMTEVSENHWCWIPELENLTALDRRSLAIPVDDSRFGYSRCRAFEANWTQVLQTGSSPDSDWKTTPCQHGWEFDSSEIPYPTIASELGWVCERDSYQASAQSFFFCGAIVGGFIFGWVADKFGRLPALVLSNLVGCLGGVCTIFADSFLSFVACRFVVGLAYDNCLMMFYILVLEYTAPKYRTMMANLSFAIFYTIGVCGLPWLALAIADWKTLSLAISIPMALAIFSPLIVPESPRWLLSKKRVEDAIQKLLTVARINKREIPPKLLEQFREAEMNKKEESKASKMDLLRRPELRKMFILACLLYMCCCIVFDALMRSVGQLGYNFFFSFTIASLTECPSLILLVFVMDVLGRRWLASICLFCSCIFAISAAFVPSGLPSVCCAVVARFTVNIAYNTAIQWAAELLPTSVRASGAATVHIFGYVATILSPYIVYLETVLPWLPLVVVGIVAGVGSGLALTLPETARKDLPQTFDDAELMVRTQRFWEFPWLSSGKEDKSGHVNETFEL